MSSYVAERAVSQKPTDKVYSGESEKLTMILASYRRHKQSIVQCHGVFDLLHIGHIRHFQQAKQHGDKLVVSITADKHVNKGPGRPRFHEQLRAEALAALDVVDLVVISHHPTAINVIDMVQPQVYVKGSEYSKDEHDITGKIIDERNTVEKHNGKVVFTHDVSYSSSSLLNEYFSPFPPEVMTYLKSFKSKYAAKEVLACIDQLCDLNILVVGETIIDEYVFCSAIGKAGKEPVLVSKFNKRERYAGGILAVANHAADFCKQVDILTYIGEDEDELGFIKNNIKNNVNINYVEKIGSPTIIKSRYLEEYTGQKLFEMYHINDFGFGPNKKRFQSMLEGMVSNYDVVIVADYGHGLLNEKAIDCLCSKSKFLAVNTQANAGNHGFNCIEKYPSADYVSIAHRELALTIRDKYRSPSEGLDYLLKNRDYRNIMVTAGVHGSITHKNQEGSFVVPAFASSVKDRVGAGDSVLAISSMCMAKDIPAEVIGFIGNMVGAQAVNIMGNKSYIDKVALKKFIMHTLK